MSTGWVVASYYYDAFGHIVDKTGGEVNNPFRYGGYLYLPEIDLYDLKARFYNANVARFMQEDTYRGDQKDPLSLNLYTYCKNESMMYHDPTGHAPETQVVLRSTLDTLLPGRCSFTLKANGDVQISCTPHPDQSTNSTPQVWTIPKSHLYLNRNNSNEITSAQFAYWFCKLVYVHPDDNKPKRDLNYGFDFSKTCNESITVSGLYPDGLYKFATYPNSTEFSYVRVQGTTGWVVKKGHPNYAADSTRLNTEYQDQINFRPKAPAESTPTTTGSQDGFAIPFSSSYSFASSHDAPMPAGTFLYAIAGGKAEFKYTYQSGKPTQPASYGLHVRLTFADGHALYAHLSEYEDKSKTPNYTRPGRGKSATEVPCTTEARYTKQVGKGQKIGESGATGNTQGATGNHLHLEIYVDDQQKDPRSYGW